MNPTLVILAAGIGSRYGGLKQMEPVGPSGEFILDYSVYDAIRAGFGKVVFVVRRDIEELFKSTMGKRIARHVAVEYVCQELTDLPAGFAAPADRKKPWGTGHALLTAAPAVNEPFGVVNADDFYGRRSYEVLAQFLHRTAAAPDRYCMVGFPLRNTLSAHGSVARGVCAADEQGNLRTVVERTRIEQAGAAARFQDEAGRWQALTGDELVSLNMWGFKPSIFECLRREFTEFLELRGEDLKAEFFIPTVVNTLIVRQQVRTAVLETPETWCGVTYPQEKDVVVQRIRALIAAGVYPANLWA